MRLVLDVDGLLHRFGRPVAEAGALLEQIAQLRSLIASRRPDPGLEVYVARFVLGAQADAVRTGLDEDLRRLDLFDQVAVLGSRPLVLGSAAELAEPEVWPGTEDGTGVMLMSGRRHPVGEALARSVPAYVLSDRRRERRPEELPIVEAERVVAESLRLPTPRPMSDEARVGTLLSLAVANRADARAQVRSATREDPRADWIIIGDRLVLYTESADLERRLMTEAKTLRLRAGVRKTMLAVTPLGAPTPGELLFAGLSYAVVLRREGEAAGPLIAWADARRRAFVPRDHGRHPESVTASGTAAAGWGVAFEAAAVPTLTEGGREAGLAALRTILPALASPDLAVSEAGTPVFTFTSPHGHAGSDDLVVVMHEPAMPASRAAESVMRADEVRLALALAVRLVSRRIGAGVLHCLSPAAVTPAAIDRLFGRANTIV